MLRSAILPPLERVPGLTTCYKHLQRTSRQKLAVTASFVISTSGVLPGLLHDRAKASLKTEVRFYCKSQINGSNQNCYLRGLLHDRAKALLPDNFFVKTFFWST